MKQGFGHYIYKETGAKYTGFWQDNMKHGKGELVFPKSVMKETPNAADIDTAPI